ncbi:hypothetical protein HGRIS_001475 [Hohenbuehelia grisea]|uniref:Serine carboxypeptidase n=1 Tax=Hohenbuehelia grisea TaxID=104357 RepID=A0ABR3JPF8_9AGAR
MYVVIPATRPWYPHVAFQPVGVGFSYGNLSSLRNSSERAACDVDDFLQVFWREYPRLLKNQFMINSGLYGGTFIPHVVNTIYERNQPAMAGEVMMVNDWSDYQTKMRWFHESNCNPDDDGNMFFNDTVCADMVRTISPCLDAIQFAYEQPSTKNRYDVTEACLGLLLAWETSDKYPYDIREDCPGGCELDLTYTDKFMNSDRIKNITGVPESVKFKALEADAINTPFTLNGDFVQPVYRLLGPSIDAGLQVGLTHYSVSLDARRLYPRVSAYNGMKDGVCPWRSTVAWMKLLDTKYQTAFRDGKQGKR